jgi:uncharacterized membrane protein YkoI
MKTDATFSLHSVRDRQGSAMRCIILLIACWTVLGTAHAQSAAAALQDCVPQRQMQEVVAGRQLVAPAAAIMTARRQVPNADVLRANLCHGDDTLVYIIVALRKDGRIVQVMIDGRSGRVKGVE